jgi:hypothetical protein
LSSCLEEWSPFSKNFIKAIFDVTMRDPFSFTTMLSMVKLNPISAGAESLPPLDVNSGEAWAALLAVTHAANMG